MGKIKIKNNRFYFPDGVCIDNLIDQNLIEQLIRLMRIGDAETDHMNIKSEFIFVFFSFS